MNKIRKLKKNIFLVLAIMSSIATYSQENYISGYIIKRNSDTIFGLLDYRNWEKNPDIIKFKRNNENTPASFKPTDIIEFGVHDEVYVSGIINTEVSPIRTDKLITDPQINIKVDTTFLQTLFTGKKSLYYYKNHEGREYFYIKQDTAFELLIYKRYLKDATNLIIENKKYLNQLALYLTDCSTIHSKQKDIPYNLRGLTNIFKYYYECSQSGISFQKKEEKISVEFGVLMGVSLTSLKFKSDVLSYLVNANYNQSTNLSAGLFFDFVLPRNQRKWSLNNELLFSSYKVKGKYEEYQNENYYSITTTEIGYSYLKINNLLRFKYPIDNVYLFLNGGISNGYAISEKNYKKKESKFNTIERVDEELALDDTRRYEQSYILGTGIKYKKFHLELRYEQGNGMSEYASLKSTTRKYYCFIGYKF